MLCKLYQTNAHIHIACVNIKKIKRNMCFVPVNNGVSNHNDKLKLSYPNGGSLLNPKRPVILGRKEGNALFNDALNTFYVRLYGVRHMIKDHSDSEKGNPLPPYRLLFPISSKGSFICTIPYMHIPRPLLHQSWSTGWNEK